MIVEINKGMDGQVLLIPPWYTVIVFKFVDTNFRYLRKKSIFVMDLHAIVSMFMYCDKYSSNS